MMNISHVCLKANSQMLEVLVQRVKTLLKLLVHVAKMPSQEQKHCGKKNMPMKSSVVYQTHDMPRELFTSSLISAMFGNFQSTDSICTLGKINTYLYYICKENNYFFNFK